MERLTLEQWLAEREAQDLPHSVAWLARELETSTQTIYQWRAGAGPSVVLLARLEALTDGRVTARSFVEGSS